MIALTTASGLMPCRFATSAAGIVNKGSPAGTCSASGPRSGVGFGSPRRHRSGRKSFLNISGSSCNASVFKIRQLDKNQLVSLFKTPTTLLAP